MIGGSSGGSFDTICYCSKIGEGLQLRAIAYFLAPKHV